MQNIGVTYIAFSGLELLKPSILNIRPFAKYIVLVWSEYSSTGEKIANYAESLFNDLLTDKLIDKLIKVSTTRTTNPSEMQDNCRIKRETGRQACFNAGCKWHLLRDCDEFHSPEQLSKIIEIHPNVECSLSLIREYVNNPTTRIKKLSGLYVPFLQKIENKLAPRCRPFLVMCDGGRTIENVKTWKIFSEEELVLHHYTFVRYNEDEIKRKYQGHGHCHRIGNVDQFVQWTKRFTKAELEQVPDYFGIQSYWEKEFCKYL